MTTDTLDLFYKHIYAIHDKYWRKFLNNGHREGFVDGVELIMHALEVPKEDPRIVDMLDKILHDKYEDSELSD